jgi:tubulin beta
MQAVKNDNPSLLVHYFALFPTGDWNCGSIEVYNTLLTTNSLIEYGDLVTMLDNTAAAKACGLNSKIDRPELRDLNQAFAHYMCNVTSNFRFPGQLNMSMRKLATNLVMFPRLKFFKPSQTFWGYPAGSYHKEKMSTMVSDVVIGSRTGMLSVDSRHGRFMSLALFGRGFASGDSELEQATVSIQNKNSSYFVEYIPNNINVCYSRKSAVYTNDAHLLNTESLSCMASTTAIQEAFKQLTEKSTCMIRKKAGMYAMEAGGIEKMRLTECESNVNSLISQYQHYQDATAGNDGDDQYEEY